LRRPPFIAGVSERRHVDGVSYAQAGNLLVFRVLPGPRTRERKNFQKTFSAVPWGTRGRDAGALAHDMEQGGEHRTLAGAARHPSPCASDSGDQREGSVGSRRSSKRLKTRSPQPGVDVDRTTSGADVGCGSGRGSGEGRTKLTHRSATAHASKAELPLLAELETRCSTQAAEITELKRRLELLASGAGAAGGSRGAAAAAPRSNPIDSRLAPLGGSGLKELENRLEQILLSDAVHLHKILARHLVREQDAARTWDEVRAGVLAAANDITDSVYGQIAQVEFQMALPCPTTLLSDSFPLSLPSVCCLVRTYAQMPSFWRSFGLTL